MEKTATPVCHVAMQQLEVLKQKTQKRLVTMTWKAHQKKEIVQSMHAFSKFTASATTPWVATSGANLRTKNSKDGALLTDRTLHGGESLEILLLFRKIFKKIVYNI